MKLVISIFIALLILFSIFTYFFVDANISYLSTIFTGLYYSHRMLLTVLYALLISGLFFCFYYFIKNSDKIRPYLKKIIFLTIAIGIVSYPGALAFDIFNYMTTSRVLFFYQENPYIIYPTEFLNEPYLEFTRAANKTALYGPVWLLFSGIPYFLGFGNFLVTLFSFKIMIAGFYAGTIFLIDRIDRKAILYFALNPLVVIDVLFSSHNDIVMIFFALLSIYLIIKKHYFSSFIFIFLSVLTKFVTLFLLPVFAGIIKDRIIGQKINLNKAFGYSAILMFAVFLLSPIREEMYPWYAVWFVVFTSFLYKNIFLQKLVIVFSFGLMLRYIPYMATGDYFGVTPVVRNILMLSPVLVFLIFSLIRNLRPDKNA